MIVSKVAYTPWQFSPASETKVERFIAAANEKPDPDRDWIKNFPHRKTVSSPNLFITSLKSLEATPVERRMAELTLKEEVWADIIDIIKNDLENRFGDVVKECLKKPVILNMLGDRLYPNVLDKFIRFIFEQKYVSKQFMNEVYVRLLPPLMMTDSSNTKPIIELLIVAFNANPKKFMRSVLPLLASADVPDSILVPFCKTVKPELRAMVMCGIRDNTDFDAPDQIIDAIYELYKHNEDPEVHSYVYDFLSACSHECCNDKTYGRLLLMFIQNEESDENYGHLQYLVYNHFSVFHKMCRKALKKLKLGI